MHMENFHHTSLLLGYGSTVSAIVAGHGNYLIVQEHICQYITQINTWSYLVEIY